jgi:hypothetical protein
VFIRSSWPEATRVSFALCHIFDIENLKQNPLCLAAWCHLRISHPMLRDALTRVSTHRPPGCKPAESTGPRRRSADVVLDRHVLGRGLRLRSGRGSECDEVLGAWAAWGGEAFTTQIFARRPSTIASQVLQVPSLQSYLILMPEAWRRMARAW